jgi:type III secretory pathway component EscV
MKMKENFKQPPCSTSPPGYPTWLKQYLSLTYVSSSYIFKKKKKKKKKEKKRKKKKKKKKK